AGKTRVEPRAGVEAVDLGRSQFVEEAATVGGDMQVGAVKNIEHAVLAGVDVDLHIVHTPVDADLRGGVSVGGRVFVGALVADDLDGARARDIMRLKWRHGASTFQAGRADTFHQVALEGDKDHKDRYQRQAGHG